jgi:glycosyltransferase involved in cell wall biosynthesis
MNTLKKDASLIFTVLNEQESLPAFLRSLSDQSCKTSQIVCVDGGSKDSTVLILREWAKSQHNDVILIEGDGLSISEGRNLAVNHASFERILVTDAGTKLDPNWVREMLSTFDSSPESHVISGWFEPLNGRYWQNLIGAATTPLLEEINPASFLPSHRSVGFTKSAWAATGGYPEWLDYCEDLVFDIKLKEAGYSFAFAKEAVVLWGARSSLSSFFRQYYRYSRGDGKANLWKTRHLARYSFYFVLLFTVLIGLFEMSFLLLVSALMIGVRSLAYGKRVWVRFKSSPISATRLLIGVPLVCLAGDIAKMLGYPVGILWRIKMLKQNG